MRRLAVPCLFFALGCSDNPPLDLPGREADHINVLAASWALNGGYRPQETWLRDIARETRGFGGIRSGMDGAVEILSVRGRSSDRNEYIASIRSHAGMGLQGPEFRIIDAQFDLDSLALWRSRLAIEVFSIKGVTGLDMDEANNRVSVHILSRALQGFVYQVAQDVDVPTEAIHLRVVEPAEALQQTLNDEVRPVPGGMVLSFTYDDALQACTIAANVIFLGGIYLLTAAHCFGEEGFNEYTDIYQPWVSWGSSYRLGTEQWDPPLWTPGSIHHWGGSYYFTCPTGNVAGCRHSDAAMMEYAAFHLHEYGYIAQPFSAHPDSGSDDVLGGRFRIDDESNLSLNLNAGTRLDKVGRVTGWTYGPVLSTCVDKSGTSWGRVLHYWCQFEVQAGARRGDSGAPVFLWKNHYISSADPDDVIIAGVLWLREGNSLYFSEWSSIERDFESEIEAGATDTGGGPPGEEEPCVPEPPKKACDSE